MEFNNGKTRRLTICWGTTSKFSVAGGDGSTHTVTFAISFQSVQCALANNNCYGKQISNVQKLTKTQITIFYGNMANSTHDNVVDRYIAIGY